MTPVMVRTFHNYFVKAKGNYLARVYRALEWIHSSKKQWWSQITNYMLAQFKVELMKLGLYEAVRATCHGIEIIFPNFFTILELYCL